MLLYESLEQGGVYIRTATSSYFNFYFHDWLFSLLAVNRIMEKKKKSSQLPSIKSRLQIVSFVQTNRTPKLFIMVMNKKEKQQVSTLKEFEPVMVSS